MKSPLVSIIIPVYNVEKYLRRCLDSILEQTFTDWECILIDDGSQDCSGNICDEYAIHDKRIIVLHQLNCGVNLARENGFLRSRGEWIMFVDADDTLPNSSIADLTSDCEGYDLVSGKFQFIDNDDNVLNKHGIINECVEGDSFNFVCNLLTEKRWKCLWRQIIKRPVIETRYFDTDKNIYVAEDFLVMLQIGLNIKRYKGIDNIVYNYRWHDESTVHRHIPNITHAIKLSNSILSIFSNKSINKFRPHIFKCLFNIYIEYALYKDINTTELASFLRKNLLHNKYISFRDKIQSLSLFIPSRRIRDVYNRLVRS